VVGWKCGDADVCSETLQSNSAGSPLYLRAPGTPHGLKAGGYREGAMAATVVSRWAMHGGATARKLNLVHCRWGEDGLGEWAVIIGEHEGRGLQCQLMSALLVRRREWRVVDEWAGPVSQCMPMRACCASDWIAGVCKRLGLCLHLYTRGAIESPYSGHGNQIGLQNIWIIMEPSIGASPHTSYTSWFVCEACAIRLCRRGVLRMRALKRTAVRQWDDPRCGCTLDLVAKSYKWAARQS
jgi:hypothetical protein